MTEQQNLMLGNLLNGVAVDRVAETFRVTQADVMALFVATMKVVAEYRFVHCVPYFDCGDLGNARRNRLQVLGILAGIERWDTMERDLVLDLLNGRGVAQYGLAREEVVAILNRTLNAIPNYLSVSELREYEHNRKAYIQKHRARVIATVEQFVSLTEPLKYKRIEHVTGDAENFETVGARVHAETSTRKERQAMQ